MPSVRLIEVSFSYRDSVPILIDANLQFGRGWTGVVGPNGAGKTTLLRIVAGEIAPERGRVKLDPPGQSARLCRQTAELLTPEIGSFALALDGVSRRIQGQFRLNADDLSRWATLSPGERKRWQVGAALAAQPDVLMLDEPTDHLDAEARALLAAGLSDFPGIGLLVSHDRRLLNDLTTYTVRFSGGQACLWRGAYDAARQSWQAEERERLEAYRRTKEEQRRILTRLADKRRIVAASEPRANLKHRMKGTHDHDSRGMMTKGRARAASARLSRDAGLLRHKSEKIAQQLGEFHFHKLPGRSLFVDYVAAPMARLASLDLLELRAGDKLIAEDVHVCLMRDSRIRVAGPNGIGKTTLLNALVANAQAARLLHLPQELRAEESAALLDSVRQLCGSERDRVLTLVAALGVDPARLLESVCPSPGEARKLKLAYGLGRRVWGLMLDEPTNHLDLPAIERLEEMLRAYPGALVIVTHDEVLARRCTTEEWRFEQRRVTTRSSDADA